MEQRVTVAARFGKVFHNMPSRTYHYRLSLEAPTYS